ncbi:hypothetical protein LWI29_027553 [Acer saccharum]|uniref:Mesoderm development candidate 2 n=1 Tax=Acer saccharum TaxID=4024 RepID=A0AA39RZX6_ACESA|nr:hypothetical protein LWI29_027553 [Acer saccharum]KAK1558424.1 hypothetical protein Q3G72_002146 [Acer saccharum]
MESRFTTLLCIFLLLILPLMGVFMRSAEGKIHISDDLDDVIDDEEDEDWKEWGKKKTPSDDEFDPPKLDFDTMSLSQIQEEMMRKQFGPAFGFVKLRLGSHRTPDMVSEIAMQWTKVLKTGALDVKFMGVDVNTVMFTMQRGQDTIELKEYILNQPEAYEIKIGDQAFRRPGDLPLDDLVEKLRREENKDNEDDDDAGKSKDEL